MYHVPFSKLHVHYWIHFLYQFIILLCYVHQFVITSMAGQVKASHMWHDQVEWVGSRQRHVTGSRLFSTLKHNFNRIRKPDTCEPYNTQVYIT